jgi:hypothetical protein
MKLIKTEDEQGVMYSLSGDNLPENYVLSKENCDEIFEVVDVKKLANERSKTCEDCDVPVFKAGYYDGFQEGFEEAMELNKDKLFTIEEVMQAFVKGQEMQVDYFSYKESLQQPTEIEVEIVMKSENVKYDGGKQIEYDVVPKLDSEGCLILKKI